MRLPAPLMTAAVLGLTVPLFALPASAATLMTFIGPDSGSATTTCSGDTGPRTGSSTVHGLATCFRADVGTATGEAVAANGHIGATAIADSHNGDSLAAEIAASAGYDDVMTFTSVVPGATTAMASVNLVLDGELLATGPVAGSSFDLTLSVAGNDFRANYSLDGSGLHRVIDNFTLEGGQIGPETAASLGTFSFMVPLNQLVRISARLESRAVASGPGSHALAGFVANSLKFASTPFDLADGVTVNAGDYIVNNHFIDPLAPTGGVPEPASWGLMILGFGAAGTMIRRRRAVSA